MSIETVRVTVDKVDDTKYSININYTFGKWTVAKVDTLEEARKIAVAVKSTINILKHEKLLV